MRTRGQSMVLFSLMLMLLALMVLVTISIGNRVSERVELQTMADAAAYSNAVATARAFNSISLMNRTQLSHMAVAAGLESVVNYSSAYYAHVEAALALWASFEGCTVTRCAVACPSRGIGCQREVRAAVQAGATLLAGELCRLKLGYAGMDAAAGQEVTNAVKQAFDLFAMEQEVYAKLKSEVLAKQKLAGRIAGASGAAEVSAPATDLITMRELQGSEGCTGPGAVCDEPYQLAHSYYAAMGTRGSGFITARAGGKAMMNAQLAGIPWSGAAAAVVVGTLNVAHAAVARAEGSAYFDSDLASHGADADGRGLTADDHGLQSAGISYSVPDGRMRNFCCDPAPGNGSGPPCDGDSRPNAAYQTYVKARGTPTWSNLGSNEAGRGGDVHEWGWPARSPSSDLGATAQAIHSTVSCVSNCPGIWPTFLDYNSDLVANADDLFGQPKNHALLQRDYAARPPDPWNPFFRFAFRRGHEAVFDNRGLKVASGADISKQHAFATGIAYYHRMGHWKEPPNFLNPFWRATLTAWDVDAQGRGSDVPELLKAAGAPDSARSLELLRAVGFRGAH